MENIFENLIKANNVYRFINELKYTFDDARIKQIKNILNKLNDIKLPSEENAIDIQAKDNFSGFLDRLTENKFKKQWSRLTLEQRYTKIEEFVIDKIDKSNNKVIMDNIKLSLDDGKLKSAKEVEYNMKSCKIINIKNLEDLIKI
jgi:hypothetical protein